MTCDECGIQLEADDWHAPHDEDCPGLPRLLLELC
jgi:hypothetical protein